MTIKAFCLYFVSLYKRHGSHLATYCSLAIGTRKRPREEASTATLGRGFPSDYNIVMVKILVLGKNSGKNNAKNCHWRYN
jgi:hypothetical protein